MAALTALAMGAMTVGQGIADYRNKRAQANGAIAQGNYEATALNQNATAADQQAADAIARGQVAESQQVATGKGIVGAQRAGFAGQGVDVGSGSAAAVQGEAQAMSALDQLTIRNNAAREAWGFQVQANDFRNQAVLARTGAQNVATGLRNGATGSLLTTGATLYGQYRSGVYGRMSPNAGPTDAQLGAVQRYRSRGY